jgi:anti-sigma regulatory factor (Ser/Thr protein kinase)
MSKAVHHVLTADVLAPSTVRRLFREWLDELDWPREETDDLLIAVSEAVSNVTDHAYPPGQPGDVVVEAECLDGNETVRRVAVTIADHGSWRPPPAWHENRRRGLPLMRACTDAMDVRGSSSGTEVYLVSRPVPMTNPEQGRSAG